MRGTCQLNLRRKRREPDGFTGSDVKRSQDGMRISVSNQHVFMDQVRSELKCLEETDWERIDVVHPFRCQGTYTKPDVDWNFIVTLRDSPGFAIIWNGRESIGIGSTRDGRLTTQNRGLTRLLLLSEMLQVRSLPGVSSKP